MKNENVLYVDRVEIEKFVDLSQEQIVLSEEVLNGFVQKFGPRAELETDPSKKQLIPYVLLLDSAGHVFVYQRNGSEKRLSQKFSAGVGGHVNDGDKSGSVLQTLLVGACREIEEEIGLKVAPNCLQMIGCINEEITEVGHSHTGVVFTFDVKNEKLIFDKEIGNPQWIDPKEVPFEQAELWTALAIKLLNKVREK